jgi:hypothetical protein
MCGGGPGTRQGDENESRTRQDSTGRFALSDGFRVCGGAGTGVGRFHCADPAGKRASRRVARIRYKAAIQATPPSADTSPRLAAGVDVEFFVNAPDIAIYCVRRDLK